MTLNNVVYPPGFMMNGTGDNDSVVLHRDTTDSFEVVLAVSTLMPTVIDPVTVFTGSRARHNSERVTDVRPRLRDVLIGEDEAFRSMGLLAGVDVEPTDALFSDASGGFLWTNKKGPGLLSVQVTPSPDGRAALVLPKWHKPDLRPTILLEVIREVQEAVCPLYIRNMMNTNRVAASTCWAILSGIECFKWLRLVGVIGRGARRHEM